MVPTNIAGLEEIPAIYGETVVQMVNPPGGRNFPIDFPLLETHMLEPRTSDDSAREESE